MDVETNKTKTVCFSGHRPAKMPHGGDKNESVVEQIKKRLQQAILDAVEAGYTHFICGMADGWDKWAYDTVAAIRDWKGEKITLEAAVPYHKELKGREKRKYDVDLTYADKVTVLSERYHRGIYHQRNTYMIENSSLLICYFNGCPGGTKFTVEQAKKKGLQIKNLYNNSSDNSAMTDDDYALCIYNTVFKTHNVGDDAIIQGINRVLESLNEQESKALESRFRYERTFQETGDALGGISARKASDHINSILIKLRNPACLREMSKSQAGKHDDELRQNLATAKETIDKVCETLLTGGLNTEMKLLAVFEAVELRLSDLELSSQCESALLRAGVNSICAIRDIVSFNELRHIKGIGSKATKEIIAKMRDLGFAEWADKMDSDRK